MPVVTPTIYESDKFIEDNKRVLIDNQQVYQDDTITAFGDKIDSTSFYISLIGILCSVILWYYTDLLKIGVNNKPVLIFLLLLIAIFITQIFSSSTFSGGTHIEQNKLIVTEQINSILIGSILFFIFILNSSNIHSPKIYILSYITLLMAIGNALNISVKKSGSSIRVLRKIKEAFLNITIVMFASVIYLYVINVYTESPV